MTDPLPLLHLLLPVVGFAVGLFGSFTGMGGAFVLTPLLAAGFGLPYNTAIGCTLAQMAGMAAVGLVRHARLGHVAWGVCFVFLAGSVPGAVLGRLALRELARSLEPETLRTALHVTYGFFLVAGATAMAARVARRASADDAPAAAVPWSPGRAAVLLLAGSAAGALAGLLALGGGIVAVPVLSGVLGLPLRVAVGTSLFQMVPTALSATAVSLGTSDLEWRVVGLLLAGSVPGAWLGPRLLAGAALRRARPRGTAGFRIVSTALRPFTDEEIRGFHELSLEPEQRLWDPGDETLSFEDLRTFFRAVMPTRPGQAVFLALDGKLVAGQAALFVHPDGREEGRAVLGFGVRSAYQGRGIAKTLVARALDHARAQGLRVVRAETYPHNLKALRLLTGAGFTLVTPPAPDPQALAVLEHAL